VGSTPLGVASAHAGCCRCNSCRLNTSATLRVTNLPTCCCTGTKVDPAAINVQTGKTYEQEFDLEQQRMAVSDDTSDAHASSCDGLLSAQSFAINRQHAVHTHRSFAVRHELLN